MSDFSKCNPVTSKRKLYDLIDTCLKSKVLLSSVFANYLKSGLYVVDVGGLSGVSLLPLMNALSLPYSVLVLSCKGYSTSNSFSFTKSRTHQNQNDRSNIGNKRVIKVPRSTESNKHPGTLKDKKKYLTSIFESSDIVSPSQMKLILSHYLIKALKSHPQLTHLELKGLTLNSDTWCTLCRVISSLSELTVLVLEDCNLTEEHFGLLISSLVHMNVMHVTVKGCGIGKDPNTYNASTDSYDDNDHDIVNKSEDSSVSGIVPCVERYFKGQTLFRESYCWKNNLRNYSNNPSTHTNTGISSSYTSTSSNSRNNIVLSDKDNHLISRGLISLNLSNNHLNDISLAKLLGLLTDDKWLLYLDISGNEADEITVSALGSLLLTNTNILQIKLFSDVDLNNGPNNAQLIRNIDPWWKLRLLRLFEWKCYAISPFSSEHSLQNQDRLVRNISRQSKNRQDYFDFQKNEGFGRASNYMGEEEEDLKDPIGTIVGNENDKQVLLKLLHECNLVDEYDLDVDILSCSDSEHSLYSHSSRGGVLVPQLDLVCEPQHTLRSLSNLVQSRLITQYSSIMGDVLYCRYARAMGHARHLRLCNRCNGYGLDVSYDIRYIDLSRLGVDVNIGVGVDVDLDLASDITLGNRNETRNEVRNQGTHSYNDSSSIFNHPSHYNTHPNVIENTQDYHHTRDETGNGGYLPFPPNTVRSPSTFSRICQKTLNRHGSSFMISNRHSSTAGSFGPPPVKKSFQSEQKEKKQKHKYNLCSRQKALLYHTNRITTTNYRNQTCHSNNANREDGYTLLCTGHGLVCGCNNSAIGDSDSDEYIRYTDMSQQKHKRVLYENRDPICGVSSNSSTFPLSSSYSKPVSNDHPSNNYQFSNGNSMSNHDQWLNERHSLSHRKENGYPHVSTDNSYQHLSDFSVSNKVSDNHTSISQEPSYLHNSNHYLHLPNDNHDLSNHSCSDSIIYREPSFITNNDNIHTGVEYMNDIRDDNEVSGYCSDVFFRVTDPKLTDRLRCNGNESSVPMHHDTYQYSGEPLLNNAVKYNKFSRNNSFYNDELLSNTTNTYLGNLNDIDTNTNTYSQVIDTTDNCNVANLNLTPTLVSSIKKLPSKNKSRNVVFSPEVILKSISARGYEDEESLNDTSIIGNIQSIRQNYKEFSDYLNDS